MSDALYDAINASPIAAAIIERGGTTAASVIFSGEDYIVTVAHARTPETCAIWHDTAAKRLVHFGFRAEEVQPVTLAMIESKVAS